MKTVAIGNYKVGAGHPLLVMAGPCVLEGYERSLMIGRRAKAICEKVGLPYVFKASFDKANRSSLTAFRGPGLEEGLEILKQIKRTWASLLYLMSMKPIKWKSSGSPRYHPDPGFSLPPDGPARGSCPYRPRGERQEGPVPGSVGHEKCHQ